MSMRVPELTGVQLCGSKIAYQYRHDEHRAKDDQHCSVWVSKVRVQAQSRESDDGEIKHVPSDGKGPAGNESVARSKRRADGLDAAAVAGSCGYAIPIDTRNSAAPIRMAPTKYTRPAIPNATGKILTGINAPE